MHIELLYFDGCPNHRQALENIRTALQSLGVDAPVATVPVETDSEAMEKRFLGSPSVRIDGIDIEIRDESESQYSMRCRRYRDGNNIVGYPPVELIRSALSEAMKNSENHG
jgi:hypothetical protein